MTVGERIKKVRNKLGMSQVDFADKINVSKQTLYKYENNVITNIPSDKIEAAARLGNVSPAYLMGWTISDEDIANVFVLHDLEDIIDNIRDFSPPTISCASSLISEKSIPASSGTSSFNFRISLSSYNEAGGFWVINSCALLNI